jgi:asparagine synthase (glutamine-hydrolysing)
MKQAAGDGQAVHTFSIGFEDPQYDETAFAARVAKYLGTTHQQFIVHPRAAEDLPKIAEVFGEPFGDSSALPTHYLSRETRKHVKVALAGDGGDELFGGYDRYRAMRITQRIGRLPAVLRDALTARLWQSLPGLHPKSKLARLKRMLRTARQDPAHRYSSYVRMFPEETLQPLLGVTGGFVETIDSLATQFDRLCDGRDEVACALAVDRVTYLPDDLLTKVDRASMLHALEVRNPFMDHELVSFTAGLPLHLLIKGSGKRLLRQAFADDLPEEVFRRPKMGFALPIGQWLRGELRHMMYDLFFASDSFLAGHMVPAEARKLVEAHEAQRADHSQRLYALVMLELWWRSVR